MRFAVYLPPQAERRRVPLLWYLAGLTCTEETFMIKAGAQRVAAELGLALVAPDTSPRGVALPGDSDAWDFGVAAGFYLDATEEPWSRHYRMYSYITRELVGTGRIQLSGRPEAAGHLRPFHGWPWRADDRPQERRIATVRSRRSHPISAPMHGPWGQKAFTGYLGPDRERWKEYDACELIRALPGVTGRPPILVDQGLADAFLEQQLMPERLELACKDAGYPLTLRRHPGYDHGYYFISTFIEDHLRHHARALLG